MRGSGSWLGQLFEIEMKNPRFVSANDDLITFTTLNCLISSLITNHKSKQSFPTMKMQVLNQLARWPVGGEWCSVIER